MTTTAWLARSYENLFVDKKKAIIQPSLQLYVMIFLVKTMAWLPFQKAQIRIRNMQVM